MAAFVRRAVPALLLAGAAFAHAGGVYRCRDAGGHLAFQDRPCAAGQEQREVAIAPAPPASPSPDYGLSPPRPAPGARTGRGGRTAARQDAGTRARARSWECRAADGAVFYRHGGCPHAIAGRAARSGRGAGSVPVTAIALPRDEACRRMAAAGSVGRAGREHDERVSTYDRNAGRDPCRGD
jgi:hypothetical protein